MRARYLPWMNSCTYDNSFLLRAKNAWFFGSLKQVFILYFFFLVVFEGVGGDDNKLYWSSFQTSDDGSSVPINGWILFCFFFHFLEKLWVIVIGPRIEKSKINFFRGFEFMGEVPFDPSLIVFLPMTKSIRCLTNPPSRVFFSTNHRFLADTPAPVPNRAFWIDSAYFLCWRWWYWWFRFPSLRNRTRFCSYF